jgi:hypothetical protein
MNDDVILSVRQVDRAWARSSILDDASSLGDKVRPERHVPFGHRFLLANHMSREEEL